MVLILFVLRLINLVNLLYNLFSLYGLKRMLFIFEFNVFFRYFFDELVVKLIIGKCLNCFFFCIFFVKLKLFKFGMW